MRQWLQNHFVNCTVIDILTKTGNIRHIIHKCKKVCLPWKNWVDYLPRVASNISNIMVLAFKAQKSNFVTTLKEDSQG